MCGRFGLFHTWQEIAAAYGLVSPALNLAPRWNIAPTQDILAVIRGPVDSPDGKGGGKGTGNAGAMCRWGLVPSWAEDIAIGARMIQARAETAAEKPAFRAAMRRRRCVVPASGFYEWREAASGKGPKQPFWVAHADGGLMSFAGLWEIWTAPDGGELRTCAVLTTAANEALAAIHHRMPVILEAGDIATWLGAGADENGERRAAEALMRPWAGAPLEARPVGREVNAVRNDGPGLIEPAEAEASAEPAPAERAPTAKAGPGAQGELF